MTSDEMVARLRNYKVLSESGIEMLASLWDVPKDQVIRAALDAGMVRRENKRSFDYVIVIRSSSRGCMCSCHVKGGGLCKAQCCENHWKYSG